VFYVSAPHLLGSTDLDSPNIEMSGPRSTQPASNRSRGGHSSHSGGSGGGPRAVAAGYKGGGSLRAHSSHAEVHVQEVAITDVRNSAVYLLLQMGTTLLSVFFFLFLFLFSQICRFQF
jgi:hypothetical protein